MPESKNGSNRDSQAGDVRGDARGVPEGEEVPRWDAERTEPGPAGAGGGDALGDGASWTQADTQRPEAGEPFGIDEEVLGDLATERAEQQLRRFKPGTMLLGRYRIVGELGRGGMGVVFRCLDETTNIHVAVKCLPPELSWNTEEMEEVLENFRLVYRLHHPNIAAVMTLDEDEDTGEYFLVMECVEGITLRRWRKQGESGRRRLEEVVPLLEQVASALDYAHSEKIVHRDIKPSNIMLTAAGDVKVLDFGLAAQIRTSLTRVSQVQYGTGGTAPYMAPEQWRGVNLGAATDQYALGVTAYELLAGRLPFESDDPAVLKQSILEESPTPIPGLDKRAWGALRRALSKDPAKRFSSCGDFVKALGGGRVSRRGAAPAGGAGASRGGIGRGRWKRAAVLVVLLAVAGAAVWYGRGWMEREGMRFATPLGRKAAEEERSAGYARSERNAKAVHTSRAAHKIGDVMTVDLGSGVTLEMVWIPPGEFLLGSTPEQRKWAAGPEGKGKPQWYKDEGEEPRRCRIEHGFWLGRTEVTVGQWKRFVEETGYKTDAESRGGVVP